MWKNVRIDVDNYRSHRVVHSKYPRDSDAIANSNNAQQSKQRRPRAPCILRTVLSMITCWSQFSFPWIPFPAEIRLTDALSLESKSSSRRQWLTNGMAVGTSTIGLGTFTYHITPSQALSPSPLKEEDKDPSKTIGLSLTDLATILTRDLTNGSTGKGGYFLTGDLSPNIFRNDCVFIDPTTSVPSLTRYRTALSNLFDPTQSTVRLLEPLQIHESDRTITGRVRSRGVLRLPWQPRVAPYESSIAYTIDNNGLVSSQVQEWNISPSEALWETVTPSGLAPPFSTRSRPTDEPTDVTELFELVNGRSVGSYYPPATKEQVVELVNRIVERRYEWKREDLTGKWAAVFLIPGPDGGGFDRRVPFPEFGFNRSYQVFATNNGDGAGGGGGGGGGSTSVSTVTNIGELLGPLMEVRVGGTLTEDDESRLDTPKRFRAEIEGGKLCLGRSVDAPCIGLPIRGEGLFDGVYLGDRLRIGQNLNGGGARVVQVKVS